MGYDLGGVFVRRIGMIEPQVNWGLEKIFLWKRKEPPRGTMIAVWQPHYCTKRRFHVNE